jgi:hypothetical protein
MLTKDLFMVDRMLPECPVDTIRQWANAAQRNIKISDEQRAKWNSDRTRICESQNLTQQRLFLLFTFIEFGSRSQVQRLLK